MKQEDIIRMAREANVYCTTRQPTLDAMLERFAALVAAAEQKKWEEQTAIDIHEAVADEREACCSIVWGLCESDNVAQRTVDSIRARG